MPLLKRPTAQLKALDVNLNVHKDFWGYTVRNPNFLKQQGTVFTTIKELLTAVKDGYRPEKIK